MLITEELKIVPKDIFVDGHRIRVAIRPGDRQKHRPLFIFNGLGANWEVVITAFETLDKDIEIIAFDMMGTGSSSTPLLPYGLRTAARIAHKLLNKLKYDDVQVLGISWGGGLAQQFAYMYPKQCKKLVLIATSAGVLMVPGKPLVLLKMSTPLRYWSPWYMKKIAGSIYGGKFRNNTELTNRLARKIKPNSLWGYILQVSALSRWTSLPWLKKIKQPTLVMAGDDDPIIPLANAKILASKIPNSILRVVKGGGHLFLLAQAKRTIPEIEKFLNSN